MDREIKNALGVRKSWRQKIFRKYSSKTPTVKISKILDQNGRVVLRLMDQDENYIRKVEFTLRDYELRDRIMKMKKEGKGLFIKKLRIEDGKKYHISFYVITKDDKYTRLEMDLDEIQDETKDIKAEISKLKYSNNEKNFENESSAINDAAKDKMPVSKKRSWPNSSAYSQTLQNVKFSISKKYKELEGIEILKNENVAYPTLIYGAGNFGVVFKYKKNENYYALKCFTRGSQYIDYRFEKISKNINSAKLDFLLDFRYYEDGVRVLQRPSEYFPIITMNWIEGETLHSYIDKNYDKSEKMRWLSNTIIEYILKMQKYNIAHGDLSLDNIIIDKRGKLWLVDYDGMYVPGLEKLGSEELGHEAFQHPNRGKYYGPKLDNFSGLVMYSNIYAISKNPDFWKYNNHDQDKLLMDGNDFRNPKKSKVFQKMKETGGKTKKLAEMLEEFCLQSPDWTGIDLAKLSKMK
ncbi:protein kinase domain-containing protein [Caldiplasma sukawensis]